VREWVIVKRLAAASLFLSLSFSLSLPVFHPFSIPPRGTPGLEILLRLTPCPIPRTHAPALTSAYPHVPLVLHPCPRSRPAPGRSFTQPPVPSTLCLVRWWRHLVQFNKRRSIMTSASELPLSSLTLAAPPRPPFPRHRSGHGSSPSESLFLSNSPPSLFSGLLSHTRRF